MIQKARKVLIYPETRQVYDYDCGATPSCQCWCLPASKSVKSGSPSWRALPKENGTTTEGVLFTFGYFGMEVSAGEGMTVADVREAIDQGHPVLLTLQAYRPADIILPYGELWDQGHYVVAIGYEGDGTAPDDRIIFEDPASFYRTFLTDGELNERWHDDNGAANPPKLQHWGCILMTQGVYHPDIMERME